jgi:hypothetical protein
MPLPLAVAIPMIASAVTSIGAGIKGAMDSRKAGQMNKKQIAQTEYDFNQRAPLRRQGMQALGQVEAPMDLGNLGFNSANPFAAARGKTPSTASYGNWGRMVTDPDVIDNAISGVTQSDIDWADDVLGATYIGKSGGKMRFKGASGKEYTNDDRNHAQQQIRQPADQRAALAGIPKRSRTGMQPLTVRTSPVPRTMSGLEPLGEF